MRAAMMNLIPKFPESWRRKAVQALGGSFDSASDNPQRTSTVMFPLDSVREIDPRDRRELVKKHRSLRNNLGPIRGIINTTVDLSVGWGLQPAPKSGNKEFDRRALAYFKRQTGRKNWSVTGKHHHAGMQRLALRETITDGEIFLNMVVDEFGRTQRQLIKTEQVGNVMQPTGQENWRDGVLLNSLQRPLKYRVLQNGLPGSLPNQKQRYRDIDARNMLHLYEQERATQTRGLPWGYTGLNHGVDTIDIMAFEKISHKLNAALIGAITTPTGGAPRAMADLLAAAKAAEEAGTAASLSPTQKDTKRGTQFLDLHGSKIPLFQVGESMQFFNARNSVSVVEFAGALVAWYAQGFGLPVDFVIGMSKGSAGVRGDTDVAGRFFERVQMMMIDDVCQPDWVSVIGRGILAWAYPRDYPGVEPLEPPPGWTGWDVVEWRGPRNIQIDKFRDGKLAIEQVRAGLMTLEEWWTLNGEDPEEMRQKMAEEFAEDREAWLEQGLPEEMFWRVKLGQNVPAGAGGEAGNTEPPRPETEDE